MLSCRDVSLKASDYLDGELSWWTRAQIRAHVLMCHHCRRYLVQLRLAVRSLRLFGRQDKAIPQNEQQKKEEEIVHLLLEKHDEQ